MSETSSRLQWVDMAKGLSILLVVMMYSAFGIGEETGGTGYLHWIIAWASPFRMPEFFAISGLFLSQVIARDWRRYADRRVVHYLYFYAIWAIIQIVFKVALVAGDPATAVSYLAWAIVEPYGVLWFIYMLAVFSAATKLLHDMRVPHWAVLAIAAVLQMSALHTGSYIVDQFADYFVYFYAGYALAPAHLQAGRLGRTARPSWPSAASLVWAVVNAALVFSPGFAVTPGAVNGARRPARPASAAGLHRRRRALRAGRAAGQAALHGLAALDGLQVAWSSIWSSPCPWASSAPCSSSSTSSPIPA